MWPQHGHHAQISFALERIFESFINILKPVFVVAASPSLWNATMYFAEHRFGQDEVLNPLNAVLSGYLFICCSQYFFNIPIVA